MSIFNSARSITATLFILLSLATVCRSETWAQDPEPAVNAPLSAQPGLDELVESLSQLETYSNRGDVTEEQVVTFEPKEFNDFYGTHGVHAINARFTSGKTEVLRYVRDGLTHDFHAVANQVFRGQWIDKPLSVSFANPLPMFGDPRLDWSSIKDLYARSSNHFVLHVEKGQPAITFRGDPEALDGKSAVTVNWVFRRDLKGHWIPDAVRLTQLNSTWEWHLDDVSLSDCYSPEYLPSGKAVRYLTAISRGTVKPYQEVKFKVVERAPNVTPLTTHQEGSTTSQGANSGPISDMAAPSGDAKANSSQKEVGEQHQNGGDRPTLAELMRQLREQQMRASSQMISEQIISTFSSRKCQEAFGMNIPGNVHILTAHFGPTTDAKQKCRIQSYVVDGRVIEDLSSIDAAQNLRIVRPGYSLPISNSPLLPFITSDNAKSRNIVEQYELAPEQFRLEWNDKIATVYFDIPVEPTASSGVLAFQQDAGQHWVPVRLDLHVTDNRPNHAGADILWKLRNLDGNDSYSESFHPAGMFRTEWSIDDEEKSWMESTFVVVDRTEPANNVANDPSKSTPMVTDGDRLSFPSNPDELKADMFRLQTEIAVMQQELGPDHPKMKQAQSRLRVFADLYRDHEVRNQELAAAQEEQQPTIVLTLRSISARNAERIIHDLYSDEKYSLAADEQTNTMILRSRPEFAQIVEALITRLEEAAPATAKTEQNNLRQLPEANTTSTESVAQLKQQASDLDLNAQKFALDVKNEIQSGKSTDKEAEKLKQQLRDAVTASFAVRQQLKRAELQLMEARLKQLQASIELREQLAEKMIDRRVEELLNGKEQAKSDDALAKP